MYPVSSQYWSAACCHPDPSQSITINFILFYYALSFLMLNKNYIDTIYIF